MAPKIERLEEIATTLVGEAPHWDCGTQTLYFVDVFGNTINKYVPATKEYTKACVKTEGKTPLIHKIN